MRTNALNRNDAHTPTATRPPLTILVQGGIASGKSTIARLLAAQGGAFVDCDAIAHAELEREETRAAIRAAFGPSVFADGRVDRRALGAIVFHDPAALQRLEALVHPGVGERVREAVEAARRPAPEPRAVVVVDAAVADKMRLPVSIDITLFVDASDEVRRRRAVEERGWAPGELERREARQTPLSLKRSAADHVLVNDDGLAEAEQHVRRFWTDVVAPRR